MVHYGGNDNGTDHPSYSSIWLVLIEGLQLKTSFATAIAQFREWNHTKGLSIVSENKFF